MKHTQAATLSDKMILKGERQMGCIYFDGNVFEGTTLNS